MENQKALKKTVPISRKNLTTNRIMIDVLIALIPVVIFAVYRFGYHALIRILIVVAVAILTEVLIFPLSERASRKAETKWERFKSRYKKFKPLNLTAPAVTGLIYAMQLPAKLNIYVAIMGIIFAMIIGKMIFGGTGQNIVNPAVIGRLFIAVAFTALFKGAYPGIDIKAGGTALQALDNGTDFGLLLERYTILDLFMGNVPGAMGEVSILAILMGAGYLVVRRAADWKMMLAVIIPAAIFFLIAGFAKYPSKAFAYMGYNLFAGGLFFAAVFAATDPITSPLEVTAKILFGLLVASITVIIRSFSSVYVEGAAFAIIFGNLFTPLLDRAKWFKNKFTWQFGVTYGVSFIAMILITFFGLGGKF